MTADELKKLAEIAGLRLVKRHFHHTDDDGCFVYQPAYFLKANFYCYVSEWQPHLRIEQAFLVVEGMKKNNPYQPAWFELSTRPNGWCANFVGDPRFNSYAESAAVAICTAALLVVAESNAINEKCAALAAAKEV